MEITNRPPLVFVEGEGSWIWDHNGKKYLDFIQGWAVNCLGHSPKVVVDVICEQAKKLINPSPAFYNASMVRLADLIVENSCFQRVFFANSGAEANEGAIKLARKWGSLHKDGAYEVITFDNGFHGRTLTTMAASGKPQWDTLFQPKTDGFTKVPANDLEAVKNAIHEKTVAVMLEPIQGEAGVIPMDDQFLRDLRDLTEKENVLLIFDEIQTGIGRTGKLFGYEHSGVEADIMTLGKSIGAGVPLSALVAKEAVCCFEPGDQGGTYNGNPLMTAVGCVVIEELIKPGFLDEVMAVSDYMREKLAALSKQFDLGDVRGKGMLLALEIKNELGGDIVADALEAGLLLNAPRLNSLRFMPSLTITREEVDQMVSILEPILQARYS